MTYIDALLRIRPDFNEDELIDTKCPSQFFPRDTSKYGLSSTGCIRCENTSLLSGLTLLLAKRENCRRCWCREALTEDDVE